MAEQTPPTSMRVVPCGKLERHAGHTHPVSAYRYGGVGANGRTVPIPTTVTVYCPGAGR